MLKSRVIQIICLTGISISAVVWTHPRLEHEKRILTIALDLNLTMLRWFLAIPKVDFWRVAAHGHWTHIIEFSEPLSSTSSWWRRRRHSKFQGTAYSSLP